MEELSVIVEKEVIPFTQVPNNVIHSNGVSMKAKALYMYMLSKPTRWKFYIGEITKSFKESKQTIYKTLNELIEYGLIKKTAIRNEGGQYNYIQYNVLLNQANVLDVPKEPINKPKNNYSLIKDKYNEYASYVNKARKEKGLNGFVTECSKLTTKRNNIIAARLKDYSEKELIGMFDIMKKSDFLTGAVESSSHSSWKVTFDWVFNPNNIVKIMEGNYNNTSSGTSGGEIELTKVQDKAIDYIEDRGIAITPALCNYVIELESNITTAQEYYGVYIKGKQHPCIEKCPDIDEYVVKYLEYIDSQSWIDSIGANIFKFDNQIHQRFWSNIGSVFGNEVAKIMIPRKKFEKMLK